VRFLSLCAILLVAACNDKHPPAPTAEQNLELNEAENMLNAMANEEGPADRSAGPSNSSAK
jgi:hypothetical protein